jgi:repressor LexA
MAALTIRQIQVLEFVRDRLEQTGKTPSHAEIARALSFHSSRDVEQQLKALLEKGLLQRDDSGLMSLLTPPPDIELPLVGRLQEGQSAPQWLKNLLHSLTRPQATPHLHQSAWVQQRLFT